MSNVAIKLEKDEYEAPAPTGLQRKVEDIYNEYRSSEYRAEQLEQIEKGKAAYRGDRPAPVKEWMSNRSMGVTPTGVENLEARILSAVIGNSGKDYLIPSPVGPEDVDHVKDIEEMAKYVLESNMKMGEAFRPIVHNLVLEGTVFMLPIHKAELKMSKVRTSLPVFRNMQTGEEFTLSPEMAGDAVQKQQLYQAGYEYLREEEKIETVEREDFRIVPEAVSLSRCYWPDTAENWEETPFLRIISPTLGTLDKLSHPNGPYKNITTDLLTSLRQKGVSGEYQTDTEQSLGITASEHAQEIDLLECFIQWRGKWLLVTYAGFEGGSWIEVRRQPLADVYPHGRKPVHRLVLFPETDRMLGTGLPHKIRHYSEAVDNLYNLMIDAGVIQVMPPVGHEMGPGGERLPSKYGPMELINVPNGSKLFPIPISGVPAQGILSFIELVMGFNERFLGQMDATLRGDIGRTAGGAETFSGMALIVQEGNIVNQYRSGGLRETMEAFIADSIQLFLFFVPMDYKMRVFEGNEYVFKPVDLTALQGSYDWKLNISDASANKALERKEAVELNQTAAQSPVLDQVTAMEGLLASYDVRSPGDWIRPEWAQMSAALQQDPQGVSQVVQQHMQQFMQQQQQQEVAGQARDNIMRQQTERQVEKTEGAGLEADKLVDQVSESAKRKAITPVIEQAVARDVLGGITSA